MGLDWSARGWARVYATTVLGTLTCIAFAFLFDSYSLSTGTWQLGTKPYNNFFIPLALAPPFFFVLLYKMRELAIAHNELMAVAATDGLTSLLNRRAFTEMVDGYLKRVERASRPSHDALLLIDVDHFKAVNDSYGHDLGDEALKLIAGAITSTVRDTDLVGRMGGEEFGVFIPQQPAANITAVAERIRRAVNEMEFVPNGHRHSLSVSVGGVIFDRTSPFVDLYKGADEKLYSAKRNGRNRVELATFGHDAPAQPVLH